MYEADGVTLRYKAFGPSGEVYYKAHAPCIDAVKASGATYVIWCPGFMKSGQRSTPPPKTLLFADPAGLAAWDFVSYRACQAPRSSGSRLQAALKPPCVRRGCSAGDGVSHGDERGRQQAH